MILMQIARCARRSSGPGQPNHSETISALNFAQTDPFLFISMSEASVVSVRVKICASVRSVTVVGLASGNYVMFCHRPPSHRWPPICESHQCSFLEGQSIRSITIPRNVIMLCPLPRLSPRSI
jgi:hypothetical protein